VPALPVPAGVLLAPRSTAPTRKMLWPVAASAAGTGVVAWLVASVDAALVLAALVAFSAAILLLIRPGVATLLAVFLLYLNVPAILTQRFGVPEALAGTFILLLISPLLHRMFVRRERLLFDTTFRLMLVLLAVMLGSAAVSRDPELALNRVENYLLEGLLLYWLVINAIDSLPALRRVIAALLAAGVLLASLSLYQQVTGNYRQEFGGLAYRDYVEEPVERVPGAPKIARDWFRAQGPVNEPNRFAQILLVLVPLAAFLFRTGPSRASRGLSAASGLVILVGIVLTLSRGALLALALLGLVMVAVRWIRASRLLLTAGVLLLTLPFTSPLLLPRIQSMGGVFKLLAGGHQAAQDVDGATLGRTTEMLAAWSAFLDHPVLGVGPGLYTPLYSVEYQQRDPDRKFRDLRVPRRAHSLYIEMAAELGVVGMAAFMGIVLALGRRLWQARKRFLERWPAMSDLATSLILCLVGYFATAVTMHLAYQRYFWLLVAMASASLHILRAQEAALAGQREGTWHRSH